MFNLKSAYFYFLALKIKTTKVFKKIYYTTNFYNNSLKSKTPEKIYFYPNSFLISSITSNKNFSFEISKINHNLFWKQKFNKKEQGSLHNFLWLGLINRKNQGEDVQRIINEWIAKNNNYNKDVWKNSILSNRIISWILNADIILDKTDEQFRNNFFQSIVKQINHLKKNIAFENDFSKKIELICAILLTGLIFKEYSNNFKLAEKELKKLLNDFFDKDAFPLNRNPNDLLKFSKYLILIKECIDDAQQYVPDYLDDILNKILVSLKSLVTSKDDVPLFNGSTENNISEYLKYLTGLNYKLNKPKKVIGEIQIIRNKKNLIYMDTGEPPPKNLSNNYQCGPLSFEYFHDEDKIITNCGFGEGISNKAVLLSRFTSAQSTICLNDTSVVMFERNKILNDIFGNSIKSSFKLFDIKQYENDIYIGCSGSHNAYEKNYGCKLTREIKINKKDNSVIGFDSLIKKNSIREIKYSIRFHLYPGLAAIQTVGGKNILIQVKKNKSLIFSCKNENLSVEKSIFLGRNKIINNYSILISGKAEGRERKVCWEIKKNI